MESEYGRARVSSWICDIQDIAHFLFWGHFWSGALGWDLFHSTEAIQTTRPTKIGIIPSKTYKRPEMLIMLIISTLGDLINCENVRAEGGAKTMLGPNVRRIFSASLPQISCQLFHWSKTGSTKRVAKLAMFCLLLRCLYSQTLDLFCRFSIVAVSNLSHYGVGCSGKWLLIVTGTGFVGEIARELRLRATAFSAWAYSSRRRSSGMSACDSSFSPLSLYFISCRRWGVYSL